MSAILNLVASPVQSALTLALQQLLSKYIKNIELTGLGVMEDILLSNLELRLDALPDSAVPSGFKFERGFIRQLRISIPYLQLLSQPVKVEIDTVMCTLSAQREETAAAGDGSDGRDGDHIGGDGDDLIFGNAGGDHLVGGEGNDILKGFSGDDKLTGGTGTDVLDGGDDFDVSYDSASDIIIKCEEQL